MRRTVHHVAKLSRGKHVVEVRRRVADRVAPERFIVVKLIFNGSGSAGPRRRIIGPEQVNQAQFRVVGLVEFNLLRLLNAERIEPGVGIAVVPEGERMISVNGVIIHHIGGNPVILKEAGAPRFLVQIVEPKLVLGPRGDSCLGVGTANREHRDERGENQKRSSHVCFSLLGAFNKVVPATANPTKERFADLNRIHGRKAIHPNNNAISSLNFCIHQLVGRIPGFSC